ncbi:hypothetical protein SMICM304S_04197 [Streptomyces microflavus]
MCAGSSTSSGTAATGRSSRSPASELDAGAREKIRAAHGGLIAMIVEALGDLGHTQPRLAAMLLQGSVDAAVRRIELTVAEEPGVIADTAVAMILRGVRGWSAAATGAAAAPGSGTPKTGSSRDGPRRRSAGGNSESGSR